MTAFPVVIVGAGQAGLSMSYCLGQAGIRHLVLEEHHVGYAWREKRWDSFCLVTPNWQCRLPGHPYRGPEPDGFMVKREVVAYLEGYAASFDAPVKTGVRVQSLQRRGTGGGPFLLSTTAGCFEAEQVVVATGSYHVPVSPSAAERLPPHVLQLHAADYRNPRALPEGEVLVVGSGQSGCQIAEDLHLAGRRVHLAVGNAPRCARRHRGKDVVEWLDRMGYYDIPIEQHPNREQTRDKTNHYVTGRDGGRDIDLRRLALEGMRLYGPLADIDGERAHFAGGLRHHLDEADAVYRRINHTIDEFIAKHGLEAPPEADYVAPWQPDHEALQLDLRATRVRVVIWCIGFRPDFSWVKLPVFDARGYPEHDRGACSAVGLYFLGLPWLHTWGSGRFSGVARDAVYLAERISSRRALTRAGVGLI